MADKQKKIKKYKPRKEEAHTLAFVVLVRTTAHRPDQWARTEKILRRELHFSQGRDVEMLRMDPGTAQMMLDQLVEVPFDANEHL